MTTFSPLPDGGGSLGSERKGMAVPSREKAPITLRVELPALPCPKCGKGMRHGMLLAFGARQETCLGPAIKYDVTLEALGAKMEGVQGVIHWKCDYCQLVMQECVDVDVTDVYPNPPLEAPAK